MSRSRLPVWVAIGISLATLGACSKSEPPVRDEQPALPPPSASAVGEATASTSAEPGTPDPEAAESLAEPNTAVMEDDIPTEEDFEDEAELRISAANLESALDELEREIAD